MKLKEQTTMSKITKTKFKFIYLEITNNCNLNCYFCPSSTLKNHEFMSTHDIKNYILELKNYTDTLYLHILGEPLTHPNFEEIVELCNKNNLKVRVTTNGTLLSKYNFQNINISKLNISLQSLINFSSDYLGKYFTNLKEMLEQVHEKLEKGKIGIDLRLWNDKNNINVQKLNKLIENYLNKIVQIDKYPNIRVSTEDEFTWPNELDDCNHNVVKCLGGKTHLGVRVNGDVVLCCLDYQSKTKIGNLKFQSLKEIIEGEIYQSSMKALQAGKAYFSLCASCSYRNRFNGK